MSSTINEREIDHDLDEDEQDALINSLRRKDLSTISFWTPVFSLLPVVISILYIPSLLPYTSRREKLLSVLSITCLLSSSYVLYYIPKDQHSSSKNKIWLGMEPKLKEKLINMSSPVNVYLPILNTGMAVVLGIISYMLWMRNDVFVWTILPTIIYIIIMIVRRVLVPLDIEGLEKMKYLLKGV